MIKYLFTLQKVCGFSKPFMHPGPEKLSNLILAPCTSPNMITRLEKNIHVVILYNMLGELVF